MPTLAPDYKEIIAEGSKQAEKDQATEKALREKYNDTPVDEIPIDELFFLFRNESVDDLPEQIKADLVNYAVQLKAKKLGPIKQEEVGLGEYGSPTDFVASQLGSPAGSAGVVEGMSSSLRGLGILPERTFEEEFDQRVLAARDPINYTSGLFYGGFVDPVGIAIGGPSMKAGLAVAPKVLSKAPKAVQEVAGVTVGGSAGGAAQGYIFPTYEEFGDSTAQNTLVGGVAGGLLTGTPAAIGAGVRSFRKPPAPRTYQDELKMAPVYGGRPLPTRYEDTQLPKETPVTTATIETVPQVTESAPATAKIQNIDNDIAALQAKAAGVNRKKRKPIERQIANLEAAKQKAVNEINSQAATVKEQVIDIENQLARLAARKAELQPGEAGAKARAARAERRQEELQQEKNILTGFDHAAGGGYKVTLNGADYENPASIFALRQRIQNNNPTTANVRVELPPPPKSDDPVTNAANEINYAINSPMRLGLDAPPSASSAGVRPALQYAETVGAGVDAGLAEKAGTMSASTARQKAGDMGRDVGRTEQMTKEEVGRRTVLREATQEQRSQQLTAASGVVGEDAVRAADLPYFKTGKGTAENIAQAAQWLKQNTIGRDYDTLVDFVMDRFERGGMLSAPELEALRPLFLEAENRLDDILRRMNNLHKSGMSDSEDMVNLIQDLYFTTYIADLRRTSGTAASHVMLQAKNAKKFTKENTRRIDQKKLITNLFGVECA